MDNKSGSYSTITLSLKENQTIAYAKIKDICNQYETSLEVGLQKQQIANLQIRYGKNILHDEHSLSLIRLFIHQFESSVVILLLIASVISFWNHEIHDGIAILAAVVINAIIGFATELKSKISLETLRKLSGPTANVLRDGQEVQISVEELVPGDIVRLEQGSRVPADLRLLEVSQLAVDESALTGESVSVYKSSEMIEGEDRHSTLVFQGTYITEGRANGLVYATGENTQIGQLGKLVSKTKSVETPLERQLDKVGTYLSLLIVVICVLLAIVGIFHQEEPMMMIRVSIALAIAAIPEGLPLVATLALAIGTQGMARHKTIVKKLSAVETLGSTTVICTDKTGTLTENKMLVTDIICGDRHLTVSGQGYEPEGSFWENGSAIDPSCDLLIAELLKAGCLCNNARIETHGDEVGWHSHGDPTEGALVTLSEKAGLTSTQLNEKYPRLYEMPFDLHRKRMSTLHNNLSKRLTENSSSTPTSLRLYVKGSPESILACCSKLLTVTGNLELEEEARKKILTQNNELAAKGLRVLGIAKKDIDQGEIFEQFSLGQLSQFPSTENIESELTFLGLVAMQDSPKANVKEAISYCKEAGINVIMLTGDQKATAAAIAKELNIYDLEAEPTTLQHTILGSEIENSSQEDFIRLLHRTKVIARVTPEVKLKVVRGLQKSGQVVAMTGDGINDAPALKQADIGVGMGKGGSDLAIAVADMVITDDNFSTIVKAIEQGRVIYANIKRALGYLLTASLSSVLTIALAILFDASLPLLPLQLLWLNLIMHVFPGLGLVMQDADRSVMNDKPRDPNEPIMSFASQMQIYSRSLLVAISVLFCLNIFNYICLQNGITVDQISFSSIGFFAIGFSLLLHAWSWRSLGSGAASHVFHKINSKMYLAMGASYLCLFVALYFPPLSNILKTRPLSPDELLMTIAVTTVIWLPTLLPIKSFTKA